MHTLADELSPIFEAELGLPEGAFDRTAAERHFSELRAVEYPKVPPEDGAGGLRISPHRDFSLFSILLMDVRSNRTLFAPSAKTFRSWALDTAPHRKPAGRIPRDGGRAAPGVPAGLAAGAVRGAVAEGGVAPAQRLPGVAVRHRRQAFGALVARQVVCT